MPASARPAPAIADGSLQGGYDLVRGSWLVRGHTPSRTRPLRRGRHQPRTPSPPPPPRPGSAGADRKPAGNRKTIRSKANNNGNNERQAAAKTEYGQDPYPDRPSRGRFWFTVMTQSSRACTLCQNNDRKCGSRRAGPYQLSACAGAREGWQSSYGPAPRAQSLHRDPSGPAGCGNRHAIEYGGRSAPERMRP